MNYSRMEVTRRNTYMVALGIALSLLLGAACGDDATIPDAGIPDASVPDANPEIRTFSLEWECSTECDLQFPYENATRMVIDEEAEEFSFVEDDGREWMGRALPATENCWLLVIPVGVDITGNACVNAAGLSGTVSYAIGEQSTTWEFTGMPVSE